MMRSGPVLLALATAMLPASVLGAAINLDVCSVESSLQYLTFTCHPIPEACIENLTEQANAWCGEYLSIPAVTVYRTTVAPVSTETVTETATATTTALEVDITTVEVSKTTTVTAVAESTVTQTITVSGSAVGVVKRRDTLTATAAPSCIGLSKNLLRRPASRLSQACSCLNPPPTTVTLDATTLATSSATATETTTVIVVVSETSVSTKSATTVATEDVTVTKTVTATATATATPYDPCAQRYGTTIDLSLLNKQITTVPGVATSRECCQLCYKTESCAGAISATDGQCGLLIMAAYPLDFPDESWCRYGWMSINGVTAAANGPIFKGPCWNY